MSFNDKTVMKAPSLSPPETVGLRFDHLLHFVLICCTVLCAAKVYMSADLCFGAVVNNSHSSHIFPSNTQWSGIEG